MSTSLNFPLVTTERNLCNLLFAYFTFTDNVKINKIYEASQCRYLKPTVHQRVKSLETKDWKWCLSVPWSPYSVNTTFFVLFCVCFPFNFLCPSVSCGKFQPLLLLSLVAKPHSHHVFFQVQLLSDSRYFLGRRPRLYREVSLQRPLFRGRYRGPLTFLFPSIKNVWFVHFLPLGPLGLLQPGLEDRFERNHVVVGES